MHIKLREFFDMANTYSKKAFEIGMVDKLIDIFIQIKYNNICNLYDNN